MQLLHVVPTYLPAVRYGGPITAVHGLCRALAARGHAVEIFTTSIDGPRNSPVPHGTPVIIDGVVVRYFASRYLRRLALAPSLSAALRAAMQTARIVHLHSVFLWPTWAAARAARRSRVPYVISPRGMLVPSLIAHRHRLLKTAWIELIERSNLENAAAIHVTSEVEAAALQSFHFRLRHLAVMPNGVGEIHQQSGRNAAEDIRALANGPPLLLFMGRITWAKGLDRLLHGFAKTANGRLAIVGDDYDNAVPELQRLAHDLNIADRVSFVPRMVVGADKELVFAAARAFVLASRSESFGNAALEAMQRGLPVIVTRDAGVSEVVSASGGGVIIGGDPQELAAAIDRFVECPTLAHAAGQAGRRHVQQYYSWDCVAAKMEVLYESLASGSLS